ncbi:DUF6113 family protein [Microbacterium sp.]|uniref:DUF6113 family protein n=1 Tax=Microbacterium sp. TaxID=51671 RepID=UPI003A8A1BC6
MSWSWTRVASWGVAAVVGAVYGVAGTIGQASTIGVIPAGLMVALVGSGALLIGMRALTGDRWAAVAAGAGMMITILAFSGPGPGGSIVVPAPEPGAVSTAVVWTLAVPALVAVVAAWPSPAGGAARDDDPRVSN